MRTMSWKQRGSRQKPFGLPAVTFKRQTRSLSKSASNLSAFVGVCRAPSVACCGSTSHECARFSKQHQPQEPARKFVNCTKSCSVFQESYEALSKSASNLSIFVGVCRAPSPAAVWRTMSGHASVSYTAPSTSDDRSFFRRLSSPFTAEKQ